MRAGDCQGYGFFFEGTPYGTAPSQRRTDE